MPTRQTLSTHSGDKYVQKSRISLPGLRNLHCLFSVRMLVVVFSMSAAVSAGPLHAEEIVGRASVIDGGTIDVHGTRIRLFAIDAIESHQSCTTFTGQRWPCGRKSALALADMIGARPVTCVPLDRDRYGRIVARCFSAGKDIAAWSVANGWALAWARYSTEYLPFQVRAESLGLGIWSGTFENPQSARKKN